MKVFKNLVAILVAIMLLFALCAPTFATQRTYVAYQIFSGTQSEGDDTGKLGDIEWGEDIAYRGFLNALKQTAAFADCQSAQDVARVVAGFADDGADARAFAKLAYNHRYVNLGTPVTDPDALAPGYYLIVDTTDFDPEETDTVYNLALLQLTQKGDFEIKEKYSVPTVEKKVYEETVSAWQDAADYDLLDEVPFRLTATIGDILDYDTYQIIFHDTLSKGLTYVDGSANVTVISGTTTKTLKDEFKVGVDASLHNVDITVNDLRALGVSEGDTVVAEYKALLNDQAIIGSAGNPNDVYLEYSNNPNDSTKTGHTPKDEVKVYTWGLDLNKVTELNGKIIPLEGAKFELQKECETPDCYLPIGTKDVVAVKDSKGEVISYTASFDGLDAGTYLIKEIKTPDGYNSIKDIKFTITTSFDGENILTFEIDDENFSANVDTGRFSSDIMNTAGVVLPETGGIGTTIFYVLGALLLTTSIVIFVTKKRVGTEA